MSSTTSYISYLLLFFSITALASSKPSSSYLEITSLTSFGGGGRGQGSLMLNITDPQTTTKTTCEHNWTVAHRFLDGPKVMGETPPFDWVRTAYSFFSPYSFPTFFLFLFFERVQVKKIRGGKANRALFRSVAMTRLFLSGLILTPMNTLGLQALDINTEGMLLSLFAFPSSFPFLSLPSLTYD